jgi:Cobalamin-5-phosphate synthase
MRSIIEGFLCAVSLCTVIPLPQPQWSKESLRYMLCFLPLVGLAPAALLLGWYWVCNRFALSAGLFAALAVLLPIWISGGIHMDGLADVSDAKAAHADVARSLQIMSDPHIGAFGVLGIVGYLLLGFGLWQQVYMAPAFLLQAAAGCIAGRAMDAYSIVALPPAKESGLSYEFATCANRPWVQRVNLASIALVLLLCTKQSLLCGGLTTLALLACWQGHKRLSAERFGGTTGDLAGYLLQKVELLFLAIAAIGGVLL